MLGGGEGHRFTCTHECDLPAAELWALRLDPDFDAYFAELDNQTLEVLRNDTVEQPGGTKVMRVCRMVSRDNPLPASLMPLVKSVGMDEQLPFMLHAQFTPGRYDAAHPYNYRTQLPVLTDRVHIVGKQWAEDLPGGRCRLIAQICVQVNVFGIGGRIERAIEEQMRASYEMLPRRVVDFVTLRQGRDVAAIRAAACRPATAVTSTRVASPKREPETPDDAASVASAPSAAPPAPQPMNALEQFTFSVLRCVAPAMVARATKAESASDALHSHLLRHRAEKSEQRRLLRAKDDELRAKDEELRALTAQLHAMKVGRGANDAGASGGGSGRAPSEDMTAPASWSSSSAGDVASESSRHVACADDDGMRGDGLRDGGLRRSCGDLDVSAAPRAQERARPASRRPRTEGRAARIVSSAARARAIRV